MNKLLVLLFLIYMGFSCYLFKGYSEMNDKLQRINDNILKSCIFDKIPQSENEKYK